MLAFSMAPQGIGLAKNAPFLNLAADQPPITYLSLCGETTVGRHFPFPLSYETDIAPTPQSHQTPSPRSRQDPRPDPAQCMTEVPVVWLDTSGGKHVHGTVCK